MACSVALVDHLLKQTSGNDILVAVVPLLSRKQLLSSRKSSVAAGETHSIKHASQRTPSVSGEVGQEQGLRQHSGRHDKQFGAAPDDSTSISKHGSDLDLSALHGYGTMARVRQLTRVPKVLDSSILPYNYP